MLADEITTAQRHVRTDAYQMSIGEIVTMYDDSELVIQPDFQRMFRWEIGQKSKLIESLLLGIPLPSIFVFEKEDGTWELIDGLQRISTILEFMGKLKEVDGSLRVPSILEATKYLPSLHNSVWEKSDRISDVSVDAQFPLDKGQQIGIRRARLGVEILKRPSDDQTKFDLFQRLNAGGTEANAQELRNCVMLMINEKFFQRVKEAAELSSFRNVINVTEEQATRQRHMELAVRFLVHTCIPYDGKLDVEEYIDEGIIALCQEADGDKAFSLIQQTFELLNAAGGSDALRRWIDGKPSGKIGLIGLEGVAVGVASNLSEIRRQAVPNDFVRQRMESFWQQDEVPTFAASGMRGTTRIQRSVPIGKAWFTP